MIKINDTNIPLIKINDINIQDGNIIDWEDHKDEAI